MKSREMLYLESELTQLCDRQVGVSQPSGSTIRFVLEPVGDRGRLELTARLEGTAWVVSDRGFTAAVHGAELSFIDEKFAEFGCRIRRRDDELIADLRDESFADSIAQFVASLDFVPVLAGFWASDLAAA